MMIRPGLLAASVALAGCASTEAVNDPEFKLGYDMGCSMAHSSRDAGRAITAGKSDLYRRGYAAGFSACGGTASSGRASGPDSGPDGRDRR